MKKILALVSTYYIFVDTNIVLKGKYMTIYDALKQKEFNSVYEKALVNLMYTHSWYNRKFRSTLSCYGVSAQQYNVLRILKGAFPTPVGTSYIQERMIDRESNVTRIVDKLIEKEFVTRELCTEDRRKMDIVITEKGRDILAEMTVKMNDIINISSGLSEAEAEDLSRLLDKMRI